MQRTTHPPRSTRLLLAALVAVLAIAGASPASAGAKKGPHHGQLTTINEVIGATELHDQGITGSGVQVAVIDTGFAPVPALSAPGKVVAMYDLSFDADDPTRTLFDHYGHGTHMAGIIAGNDPATGFTGVAPDAELVSFKVGDNTGAVDVTQVIAALDFIVANNGNDGLDIDVINISYGVNSTNSHLISPLTQAVQRAWDAGIVVVAATGNDGKPTRGMTFPARDPFVIAVGAANIKDYPDEVRVAGFSTGGDADRKVDVIAPGKNVVSLRVPGSAADLSSPGARVGDDYFKGSGSSQAAAVVTGAIALLLEDRPDLTPDQVKKLLRTTATEAKGSQRIAGKGMIDVDAAAAHKTPGNNAIQTHQRSDGSGGVHADRGEDIVTFDGVAIEGEVNWAGASWTGASWTGASWTGASWTGASWTGASWTGASWTGASWTGASWTGASWTGASWTGASWTGASWTGASWTGASWTGASWTGA
ncbi:MAG: S8 family serine peptidase, partial [Actinomycetota bacterium]